MFHCGRLFVSAARRPAVLEDLGAGRLEYLSETLVLGLQCKVKKISNDQELIQSDPTSCPQNQKGNN